MEYKYKERIVIDTREQLLLDFPNWQSGVVRKKLDTGDYSVEGYEDIISVERKTLDDLVNCLGRKNRHRFFRCMDRLEKFPFKFLMLETGAYSIGKGAWRNQYIKPIHVIGTLNALTIKNGIQILYYANADVASLYLENLFHHFLKNNRK